MTWRASSRPPSSRRGRPTPTASGCAATSSRCPAGRAGRRSRCPGPTRTWCASCSRSRSRRSPTARWRSPRWPGRPDTARRSPSGPRSSGVNAKGACIGPMGARVRAVMSELGGEKIDIIDHDDDPATFVGNALSPARAMSVTVVDPVARAARVVVPDFQLSLAIGKEGQNATAGRPAHRLAHRHPQRRPGASEPPATAAPPERHPNGPGVGSGSAGPSGTDGPVDPLRPATRYPPHHQGGRLRCRPVHRFRLSASRLRNAPTAPMRPTPPPEKVRCGRASAAGPGNGSPHCSALSPWTGYVVPDPRRRLPGRGAWLHPDEGCLLAAERRRAFGRALRVSEPLDTSRVRGHLRQEGSDGSADRSATRGRSSSRQ